MLTPTAPSLMPTSVADLEPESQTDTTSESCGVLCDDEFWEDATVDDVRAVLVVGVDLAATDDFGDHPLMYAIAYAESTDIIRLLLEYGANPNQANDYYELTHMHLLTSQLEYLRGAIANGETPRIAYTTNGEPTATIIKDSHSVLDHTLFQMICQSEEEAHYAIAIVNSNELAKQAKPLCSTNWAKEIRHFHKHAWKLPIPRYDASDPLHFRLSELGATAEWECQALIAKSDIMTKPAGDTQSRAVRRVLRHEWQPNSQTARAIEVTVAQLLRDPAQAALAERQMGVR